jgi:phosphatidylglycerol:prolipoprotein diacylglycerol transferase
MYPVLFKIGGFAVHTYGVFIAIAVLAAMIISRYEAKRLGVDPDKIVDACFYVIIAAIVGSRILYIFTNLEFFLEAPLEMFKIWNGGLVFYGGFIGALVVVVIYLKVYRLPLGKSADIAALALPMGHFFGRIGCLFAGCCYGKICSYPWAISFRHPDSLAPLYVQLHPTQLYSAGSNFFIFIVILILRRFKQYDGQLFWIYFAMYGINRSVIELFRGDFRGTTFFNIFSISQGIGISFTAIAIIMLIVLGRKHSSSLKNVRD